MPIKKTLDNSYILDWSNSLSQRKTNLTSNHNNTNTIIIIIIIIIKTEIKCRWEKVKTLCRYEDVVG